MGKLEELEDLTKSMKGKMEAMRGFITACGLDAEYVAFVKEYDELIAVDQTVILFTEPENLIAYLERAKSTLNLSNQDCQLLIDYMENHGYSLGESCGMLVRADISEESNEVIEYSMDDAIDTVREWWNESYYPGKEYLFEGQEEIAVEEGKALLQMFDQTTYGKIINESVEKMKETDVLIPTDSEVVLFLEPEFLMEYLGRTGCLLELSKSDCQLLIDYMEGHGYSLGESCGMFVRVDINEGQGEVMEYSIDDAIDVVCEWNYELTQEAKERRDSPENFLDFCSSQDKYTSLIEDEKALLKMFDQTTYGKMVNALAEHPGQKNDRTETLNDTKETQQHNGNKKEKVR